jgi:chromosome segregation ATPase
MKKSISILFCLFMFPLFLNTSLVNAQGVTYDCTSIAAEDGAARIKCYENNEKAYRARINELRRQNNIKIFDYNTIGPSCQRQSKENDIPGTILCHENNAGVYRALIAELMQQGGGDGKFSEQEINHANTEQSQAQGYRTNELSSQLQECKTTSEQNKAQLEVDRTTIEEQRQGINALSNLLQESRAKHLTLEDSYSQLETELAGSRKSLDELTIQIETNQETIEGITLARDQFANQRNEQRDANEVLRTQLTEQSDQLKQTTAELDSLRTTLPAQITAKIREEVYEKAFNEGLNEQKARQNATGRASQCTEDEQYTTGGCVKRCLEEEVMSIDGLCFSGPREEVQTKEQLRMMISTNRCKWTRGRSVLMCDGVRAPSRTP